MLHADPHRVSKTLACSIALSVLLASSAGAQNTFVSVGAEIDDESGHLLFASVGGSFTENTSWDLAASSSDTSTDFSGLSASAYDAGIYHDFGRVGLRVGYGSWGDGDFLSSKKWRAALDFHGDNWSFALQSEMRGSEFEPINIDRTITRRDGSLVTIRARADCELDDTGIGARLRVSGGPWTYEFSGMSYDYDALDCAFSVPALDFLRQATRGEFVQFADSLTRALSFGVGLRVLAETSLLDSRMGASLSYEGGKRIYNVYYDRLEEVFFGLRSDTLSGGVNFILPSGNEIEVYVGSTDSDGIGSIGFLGFMLLLGF